MTQEELKKQVEDILIEYDQGGLPDPYIEKILDLINKHVSEVIGEYVEVVTNPPLLHREKLIAEEAIKASKDEQRKRAGL